MPMDGESGRAAAGGPRNGHAVVPLPFRYRAGRLGADNRGILSPNTMSAETLARADERREPLRPEEVREMQLRASALQLRIGSLAEDEREEYRRIMDTLRENDADDWGD
jgi:hypothetical protein